MDNIDDKYRKKNPFSVPEDYFEQLTDRIMEHVQEKEKKQRTSFWLLVKPYMGLVAIFVLALFVVQVLLPHFIDESRMIRKEGSETLLTREEEGNEDLQLDSGFNPTEEEILEYLSTEMSDYELVYAELY